MNIPLTKPFLGEEEKSAVNSVIDSGWLVQGKNVERFEDMIKVYTGAEYAKATSSCTTALHLALLSLGIGKGDKVLVPSFTFVATANVVEYVGAMPIFVDIDLGTFNISIGEAWEKAGGYDSRIKVIMPVHLFGLCADMSSVMEIARRYNLFVIEDSACALGSLYKGKHAGTMGNAGTYSFHPRKTITTGEGGMMVTNDKGLADNVDSLRNQGASASSYSIYKSNSSLFPEFNMMGFNYRMTDIQGAMGVEQMKKINTIIQGRVERAKIYDKELDGLGWLKAPVVSNGCKHTYQSYVIMLRHKNGLSLSEIERLSELRIKLMAGLAEKGIATRQGTTAVHATGYYKVKYGIDQMQCPNALVADRLSITLPLYPWMTDDEQSYVVENLKKIGNKVMCK